MKYYSTNSPDHLVDLRTAVLHSLPADRGLYMPEHIPMLSADFYERTSGMTFSELAYEVAHPYLTETFSDEEIRDIVNEATSFGAPVVKLSESISVLELWHGPSLAFKDFGARFMAAVMSRLVADQDEKLTILVATSGDTGGAVASGFLGVDGVEVIILYPSGGVSPLQEKQLTTLGQNIQAVEIKGTFDDCQAMVKRAFLDAEINEKYMLSSANSINITRLIPQSFYYFNAARQLANDGKELCFCVPSGNFGNVTAGVLAKRMGLPIKRFIAATNANDVVPRYLMTGDYEPHPSIATISNAMDVGAPSNFARLDHLYNGSVDAMRQDFVGYSYDDGDTRAAIRDIHERYEYTMDPHGAVGYLAAESYLRDHAGDHVVILETAHPAKFLPVMEPILGDITVPRRLSELASREKEATLIENDYEEFKEWLGDRR